MEYQIARRSGRPPNTSKMQRDLAVIKSDKPAMEIGDPSATVLNPDQQKARIQEHNRKYPDDQMTDASEISRYLAELEEWLNRIEDTDKKQQKAKGQ
jgi:hypothetical protein